MGNIWIRSFSGGLDARKVPEVSEGGTLLRALNGHIDRGGAFVQRADFVKVHDLPEGQTVGLSRTPEGLVVFGSGPRPADLDSAIIYEQLESPEGRPLIDVPNSTLFGGDTYSIGEFAGGDRHVFHAGARAEGDDAPAKATALLTHIRKMFVAGGSVLRFSNLKKPLEFSPGSDTGVGAGFLDLSIETEGASKLTALAKYSNNQVAVFSEDSIQTWFFDPNPDLAKIGQTLEKTGTFAPRSVTAFGVDDVFYLDTSGVRSLRARDSSNSPATTDIGSAIDPLITEDIDRLGLAGVAKAIAVKEPRDGSFWLILPDKIYVFSYFTASKISAWSLYEPGFEVKGAVVHERRVYLRSDDAIYAYGGIDERGYSYSEDVRAEAWTPYLDANAPTRVKSLEGVDASVRGEWEVRVGFDPRNPHVSDQLCIINGPTFNAGGQIGASGGGTHISVRFISRSPVDSRTPAKVCSAVITHDLDPKEDS
ncbi:hypothetical protein [Polycladidibacter hongkongensis]|uniref:hypothetical protein n=1 Tax=Polycladidibacter hongkongensis TaxID=1647556 RepID=UPI00082B3A76|nr:hypothetical protein [Pseudovibrio hongkongensis]